MAYEIPNLMITLPASVDHSANQFKAMVATSGNATLAGAGVAITGVLQNKPSAAGHAATIMAEGVTMGVVGAGITVGAGVETDADGKFITLSTGIRVGIALQTATAEDQVIPILLK